MNTNFYDIESLENVYSLANYDENRNHIDVYILCDTPELLPGPPIDWQNVLRAHIRAKNLNFNGSIAFYDLKTEEANRHLSRTFGCSNANLINDPLSKSDYDDDFRLVCDTDPDYDSDKHPYLLGYNSYNYDTTSLALYFADVWNIHQQSEDERKHTLNDSPVVSFHPITAKAMRAYNDTLFTEQFKSNMPSYLTYTNGFGGVNYNKAYDQNSYKIRKNMLLSGRHLDVARLNEKQSKVALKRLLGMLGFQILESDKLAQNQSRIENTEQLFDLIAYNVSDIVNLKELFYHKFYQAQFELKLGLLQTYPETIYNKLRNAYKPDIRPCAVDKMRLNIDSSSAQFATRCLCPYDHLVDLETVSFMYPAKEIADELGIQRVNVLDEAKKFFYKLYPQPEIRKQFDGIYDWYKSIEGKNFNDSRNYQRDYGSRNVLYSLKEIEKPCTFLPYFDGNGDPTSCFVLFSTGGVHGAEYNNALYQADRRAYADTIADFEEVMKHFPNPVDLRKAKTVIMNDGRELPFKDFLKPALTIPKSEYRDYTVGEPRLHRENSKGMTELNKKYSYTSAAKCNHEDFTSYYPNLLRMMRAFFNIGLNYDRYAEIFQQKEDFGKLMKDKTLSVEERARYSVLREGTKLILNSASGAADAPFENNIRVNNQIISMRIIGQIFSWRIGQAQTFQGANIISTNTDGLYSKMDDDDMNNLILAQESKDIGVAIEPEPMVLISKDTNNRIEVHHDTLDVISSSGGTLGCRMGPNPTKALSHSAILDWALSKYLIDAYTGKNGLSFDAPFDDALGLEILKSAIDIFDRKQFLLMFQNVIASSPGSINYIFATTDENQDEPIILQHYNRMFILKDSAKGTMHLWSANAKTITQATKDKRKRDGNAALVLREPIAVEVLQAHGYTTLPFDKDIVCKKVTNIDPEWNIYLQNKDLNFLTAEEVDFIIQNLDYDKYLDKLRSSYESSWMNATA